MTTLLDALDDAFTISSVLALMQEAQTLYRCGGLAYDIAVRLREAIMLTYLIEQWDYRETLRFDISLWVRFDWYEYSF